MRNRPTCRTPIRASDDARKNRDPYDHLDADDLEAALDLVPDLPAISGSKLATGFGGERP